jgi:hypothetical protein
MKTYTIIENLITYEPAIENGVNILKPTGTELISETQAYTDKAMKQIEMYAGSISPFSLSFDDQGRVKACRLMFDMGVLSAKEIIIKRNR